MKTKNESGVALIIVLLFLILMGALMQTFIVKVMSSQKMMSMDMRTNRTERINLPAAPAPKP